MKASQSNPYELLLEKAERFIRSAKLLSTEDDLDSAASRLYYAMFFTAQALLQTLGLTFSSHRATISAFGQHFSKTKELDPRYHKALLDAFDQRQLGDYAVVSGLHKEDWDFGDGNTSSQKNPVHTYTEVDSYTVTLIVTQGTESNTLIRNNYIHVWKDMLYLPLIRNNE